jgi:hypothetical protein
MNEEHFELLRSLARSGVRFVTVGSAGLVLTYPSVQYPLQDSDVLLLPEELPRLVGWAQGRGGTVTVWGEPWDPAVDLTGKHYVRAWLGRWHLDASFEDPDFDVPELLADARWIEGIPVCRERELWAGKLRKDAVAARRFAAEHSLVIPTTRPER